MFMIDHTMDYLHYDDLTIIQVLYKANHDAVIFHVFPVILKKIAT